MIEIAPNKYEHNLLDYFWTYKPKNKKDQKLCDLIGKVCRARLVDRHNCDSQHMLISNICLTEEEQISVEENNLLAHPNLEVKTRFLDVMMRFFKGKGRLEKMKMVSDGYLQLYKETGTVLYLIRSIERREVKTLYDEDFLREFHTVVANPLIHPSWMTQMITRVISKVDGGLNNSYIKDILTDYATEAVTKEVYWKDSYLDMLKGIGALEAMDYHYQKALNWEKYADQMEASKKENVFNVALHSILQNSFNEINQVRKSYTEDYKRIKDKYNVAKKAFVEAMSLYGVKYKYEVPQAMIMRIQKMVAGINVVSAPQVLICYLTIPFFASWKQLIDDHIKKSIDSSSVMERFFPQSHRLDDEGNVTGISDFEHSQSLIVHGYVRATLLYYIICVYERIGEHTLDFGEALFRKILKDVKPSFVEEDRVQIWAQAYNHYFDGDIVTACHLLMPQFEHALHNLLEEIVEDVTMLDNDIQKEPTLVGILNQLKPFCNPALYDELYMFLVDGNDVNFRNRLLHGLMGTMEMIRYGHYLFYLANLLFFKRKDFLRIGEN